MWNSKPIDEHRRKFLQAIGLTENLPRELVIHHLDNDKRNNDINNLSLMTITAHNRIHSHVAWNKGIKAKDNKKWANAIEKRQKTRRKTCLGKWKMWYKMRQTGATYIQIADKTGYCRETVSYGARNYEKHIRKGEDLERD